MQKDDHAQCVDSWMERLGKDAPAEALLSSFQKAWADLWRRAARSLGPIALESIAELVRTESVERYPFLSELALGTAEISCKALLEKAGMLERDELRDALRFILIGFISIIGDLTDEVLTPGLYEALSPAESPLSMEEKRKKEVVMAAKDELISTGIPNLDTLLSGGLIKGSSTAIAGLPGSGKTILAQQISFHNATPANPVLYFSTLSEPGAKTLFYLHKFSYFDQKKIDECLHFIDLGVLLRARGLTQTLDILLEHVKKLKPSLVVVDSYRVFEDMASSGEELRKFTYELVVNLMARRCTSLFIGEYGERDFERNPLFSIIDGLVMLTQRELSGEKQRFIQVLKMRGAAHSREEQIFRITPDGVEIFASRLTIKRAPAAAPSKAKTSRCTVGIQKLDDLLGGGIPRGSSLLIAGVAGTGKTVLGLEFVYRGALAGEKGVVFSFEETETRLRAAAAGLGWDLDAQIESGMVEIVFIPQPDILVEHDLMMMREKISAKGISRVVVDSLSVFLHKMTDPKLVREKVFQLASIVQNTEAVGFFTTDVPYGSSQISRFGVEETVVDGVIILSSSEEGLERQRYIEVYKLRNTAHLEGRHSMTIEGGGVGIQIFPRYRPMAAYQAAPPPAKIAQRLSSGTAGLDKLLDSGLLVRSLTLVSGCSGIGKTLLGMQFLLAGASRKERGLFVTLEEAPEELLANAAALGLPLKKYVDEGIIELLYLPPTHIRSTQLLAVLTDKVKQKKVDRLVLDSTTHIVASGMSRDDVRELVYDLAVRFKDLGVTSFFTLESDLMYSADSSTDTYRGFAPLADNVVVLRYVPSRNQVISTLMVVKTRGSTHDHGLYSFTIGKGGLKVGSSLTISGATGDVLRLTGDQQAEAAETGRRH